MEPPKDFTVYGRNFKVTYKPMTVEEQDDGTYKLFVEGIVKEVII